MSKDVFTKISGDCSAGRCGDCCSDLCFCDCHEEADYDPDEYDYEDDF